MKKGISILVLSLMTPLLLTGCLEGSDDSAVTSEAGKTLYSNEEFSISVPEDWRIIEENEFTSNVPTETVVVFRNNIKNEVFTANLNITKSRVEEGISSEDFGLSTLARSKNSLVSFAEIDRESRDPGYIIEFEGKKTPGEAIIRFRQLYIVDGTAAYTVTAAFLPSEDESVVNMLDEMLNSFSLNQE